MWLKVFGIFAIVGFLGVSAVSQDQHPFHHLLRSDSENTVSVYKVNLTTKSGIVKSGFENIVQISMKMIVQQYKNNTIFVRAIVENESRWKVKSFDVKENLVENDHDNNGKNFLKKLTAKQHVFFTPGKAGEVEHFLHTFYDIQLVEDEIDILVEKPSKDMFNFNDVHKLQIVPDDSGLLIFKDFRELTSFSDRSDSRNMSEITKLFFMLVTYKGGARKIFIRTDGMSDKMLTRDIASIVDYMKLFTEEELFTIYNATTDTTIIRNYNGEGLKFFLELLPLVGTSSATILTAKLIMDPEVEINREKMLSKLAGSITQASRESIKILKNLTMMENAPLEAFLAYSIAVSAMSKKTSNCYKGCYFLQNENEERLDEGFQYLLQRLNASVNYREQVVLVQAIGNLCYYKTFEALKSFKSSNKDLLIHIMYALGKSQMDSANYVEYFTNLIKQDLPTEARSVAVRLLLEHKYWDLNFEALTKRIYAEKDRELYNMFISSAEIFIEHLNVEQNANRMLRRLEPDARSRRFFFRAKKDQLGHLALSGHIIFDNTTKGFKQLRLDIVKYTYFEYVELYSFLLRVSDVAPISQLNNIGEDFFKQKNFTYEISLTKGSRTIFSTVAEYDFESLKKIVVSLLQNHFDEKEISKNFSINDVFSLINVDCFFPTDSGIYARAYHQTPFALDFMLKADKRVEDEKDIFGLILRANASLQNIQGLEILQPSLMFLQGSRQIINFQFTEQVALDGYHDQSKGFKNFLISKNKTFDPLFGLHYKKDTEVYLNFLKNTDELPLVVGEDRPDKEYRKTELTMQTFMDKLQQLFQQSLDELERINRFGYLNVTEEEVNPDKISLAKGK
uniref:Vitellogenin domain-containing protein n=2 Tax=Lutzomyia longipalpis TaxID=7200 RepID=A0A1B0CL34_LUTLO